MWLPSKRRLHTPPTKKGAPHVLTIWPAAALAQAATASPDTNVEDPHCSPPFTDAPRQQAALHWRRDMEVQQIEIREALEHKHDLVVVSDGSLVKGGRFGGSAAFDHQERRLSGPVVRAHAFCPRRGRGFKSP